MDEQTRVQRAKRQNEGLIFSKPNVVGVGIGYKSTRGQQTDRLSVVALVHTKLSKTLLSPKALLPQTVDDVAVDVVEVGELKALQARTERWRPAPPGVSLGHYLITAGTFGAVVRDRATGRPLILSNNHVLANINMANLGDPILQPGLADGGQVRTDTLGFLERFVPIDFGTEPPTCPYATGTARIANALARLVRSRYRLLAFQSDPTAINRVDAAVARPVEDDAITDEILEIGVVQGTVLPQLGMPVRKSGRTTGLTSGEITVLDATVSISYGEQREARFENQIVTGAMSQGGDSGSLLVAGDPPSAVGLLFGGSLYATIHNPIQAVLDALEVDI
jgi:hypothetical protein